MKFTPTPLRITVAVFALGFWAVASGQSPNVRVTTWNLEWFPNGSPKELAVDAQNVRIAAAAGLLRQLDPDILLLQEVKDYDACARLAEGIRPGTYQIAICSAFRQGRGLGKQQVAILAKYQAQAAWAEPWKSMNGIDPPRGFAFAWFKIGNDDIGVYSLHLKSNLIVHGDREAETTKNIQKREVAIAQLLTHIRDMIGTTIPTIKGVVIGGDFNTNHDQAMFSAERTLDSLADAGYQDGFEELSLSQRVTHPGSHGFPDATFDFLFAKNLTALQPTVTQTNASDHWPVTRNFRLH
jgi:endonuclease/exonuclease/phosphatase family metal-dependent hydrolase